MKIVVRREIYLRDRVVEWPASNARVPDELALLRGTILAATVFRRETVIEAAAIARAVAARDAFKASRD